MRELIKQAELLVSTGAPVGNTLVDKGRSLANK